jgi:ADP-ribose pyrophosphatase
MSDADRITDEAAPQRVVETELVFEGRVWDIRRDRFVYGEHEIVREYMDHPGAVAILAMDDDERVLLIQQYRHPIGQREWELPAGLLDVEGEDPLEAAKRELGEEVDLVADDWSSLVDFHPSPGGSNELIRIFLAKGLTASTSAFDRSEEEADIRKLWVSLDEAVASVLEGRIHNSILMLAVLAANAGR